MSEDTQGPDPWATYARYQRALARLTTLSPRAWGLEEALNRLCEPGFTPTVDLPQKLHQCVSGTARKERMRVAEWEEGWEPADPKDLLEQVTHRQALENLAKVLHNTSEGQLLLAVVEGESYETLAQQRRQTPAALRTQVSRLRDKLSQQVLGAC